MNLEVQLVTEKAVWENYLASRPEANFLQSWNWQLFHQRLGKTTFALAFQTQGQWRGAALVIKEEAKRGTYLTVAGGPLIDWQDVALVQAVSQALRHLAQQHGCQFVRIRPQAISSPALLSPVQQAGYLPAPMHLTADLTLQLDLSQSEEQLLAGMRKNTRYEVRRAEKLGLTVNSSENPTEIRAFYDQQLAVAKKHHFVPFSYDYLYHQFVTFAADHQVRLFHAIHDGQLLASAFIIFYHHEAFYHYGISTPANDRLPGAYACQWAAIRWAKAHGGQRYNFWGIAPEDQPQHRFAGVSLFKRGFGGQEVQYLPAHDLPVAPGYHLVRGFELLRKRLRKL